MSLWTKHYEGNQAIQDEKDKRTKVSLAAVKTFTIYVLDNDEFAIYVDKLNSKVVHPIDPVFAKTKKTFAESLAALLFDRPIKL